MPKSIQKTEASSCYSSDGRSDLKQIISRTARLVIPNAVFRPAKRTKASEGPVHSAPPFAASDRLSRILWFGAAIAGEIHGSFVGRPSRSEGLRFLRMTSPWCQREWSCASSEL